MLILNLVAVFFSQYKRICALRNPRYFQTPYIFFIDSVANLNLQITSKKISVVCYICYYSIVQHVKQF